MGAHSSRDPDDPLTSTSEWWQSQHPPDETPTARYRVPERPVGLPEDRYGEDRPIGRAPLVRPAPPIRTEGMPTQDRPRSPQPVAAAALRTTPAERPSLVVRGMDRVTDVASSAGFALAVLIFAAVVTAWAYGADREIGRLSRENRDLRQVQISQQQRLTEAETEVEQARSQSTEAKEDTDNLQRRLAQLEEDENPSGS